MTRAAPRCWSEALAGRRPIIPPDRPALLPAHPAAEEAETSASGARGGRSTRARSTASRTFAPTGASPPSGSRPLHGPCVEDGGTLAIWTNFLGRAPILAVAAEAGFPALVGEYVWAKLTTEGGGNERLARVYEVALVLRRAPLPQLAPGDPARPWAVVAGYDEEGEAARWGSHPNHKPFGVLEPLLRTWSRPGDLRPRLLRREREHPGGGGAARARRGLHRARAGVGRAGPGAPGRRLSAGSPRRRVLRLRPEVLDTSHRLRGYRSGTSGQRMKVLRAVRTYLGGAAQRWQRLSGKGRGAGDSLTAPLQARPVPDGTRPT